MYPKFREIGGKKSGKIDLWLLQVEQIEQFVAKKNLN